MYAISRIKRRVSAPNPKYKKGKSSQWWDAKHRGAASSEMLVRRAQGQQAAEASASKLDHLTSSSK